jgi:hypothetical protein
MRAADFWEKTLLWSSLASAACSGERPARAGQRPKRITSVNTPSSDALKPLSGAKVVRSQIIDYPIDTVSIAFDKHLNAASQMGTTYD